MATDVTQDPRVRFFSSEPRKLLIAGDWVDAASGRSFDTIDPATGSVLCEVAEGDAEDVERAVRAARAALEGGPWPALKPSERGRVVNRIGDLIMEHADELAELEALDNGKPVAVARAADVALAADLFWYMGGYASKLDGATIQPTVPYLPDAEFHAYTLREPVGVVAQIIPWNFPLLMAAWKLGPALACGNTVILKPAEQTPLSALRLGELCLEAGVPPGVVNVVPGYGRPRGARLAAHPGVDKVAFTGSTEVGKLIVRAAIGNLKRVSLELGGKSPNIVFPDADMAEAVPGVAQATFFNAGQCCIAGTRVYAHRSVFDDVVAGMSEHAQSIKVGSGLDADTDIGPLGLPGAVRSRDRLHAHWPGGRGPGGDRRQGEGGAGVLRRADDLRGTQPADRIVREEIFGPVFTAMPFDDLDDLARQANDTEYGLGAGIWTKDVSRVHKLAKRLRAGTVYVNCWNVFDAALPFGGHKQSGWGREMHDEVLEHYTETKTVVVKL